MCKYNPLSGVISQDMPECKSGVFYYVSGQWSRAWMFMSFDFVLRKATPGYQWCRCRPMYSVPPARRLHS